MVEYGENVSQTLRKELNEEALRSKEGNKKMTTKLQAKIDAVFDKGGALVYAGMLTTTATRTMPGWRRRSVTSTWTTTWPPRSR